MTSRRITFGLLSCLLTGPLRVSADNAAIRELAEGNQRFACDLYKALAGAGGNLFFSPHSISTALAMTYAGARELTEAQMGDTLHFPFGQSVLHPVYGELERHLEMLQSAGDIELYSANSLWPHQKYNFLPAFINVAEKYYRADVFPSDYGDAEAVRVKINAWVEDKTKDKIKNLVPEGALNDMTRLVLANAVYFKGKWLNEFKKVGTREMPFHTASGTDTNVQMMSAKLPVRLAELPGLQVLELPYRGEHVAMVIALPADVNGLPAIEATLSVETLRSWNDALSSGDAYVSLPRFTMTAQFELNRILSSLGMIDAFDPTKADFSGMDGDHGGLYISDVIHKAFIDVNEEGTEAAAATAVIARATSVQRIPEFRADHPFMFLITDKTTGSILFAGRMTGPEPN